MLKNYFLVAIRHLKRQPAYAALNILGLTIGTVSCLLIVLYLNHELSFDSYHDDAEKVFRVSSRISEPDDSFNWAVTQYPLGKTVTEEFTEVEQYARFVPSGRTRFRRNDVSYYIEDTYLVDSTVFQVLTFDFIAGDKSSALNQPNSIVLSESEANRIFKGENPIGEIIESDNYSYTVRGVYKDQPRNSHILVRSMASLNTVERLNNNSNWGGFNIFTYLKLRDAKDADVVEDRLNSEINEKYVATIFDQFDIKIVYRMLNIQDIHLKSDYEGEPTPLGNQDYIFIFSAIAAFLVLIACINYMNLATARSIRRALEVGMRKTMGATRGSLVRQFLAESILIAMVSLVISILILLVVTPLINSQMGTYLDLSLLLTPKIVFGIIGLLLVTGVVSGSYPAFYLSGYTPINALRGGATNRSGSVWLRRVLVGLQFAISIFMLIGTLTIYDQMQYVQNADLGFDREGMITFRMNETVRQKWPVFRNNLLKNPDVLKAATASTVPGRGYSKNLISLEQNDGVMEQYGVNLFAVDFEYFDALDVEIVQGRNFSNDYSTDTTSAVIVNESMVERLAWDDPIGKKVHFEGDSLPYRIVGVSKDFHHLSLYNPIEALAFFPGINNSSALVKIGGDIPKTVSFVREEWSKLFPNIPLEYTFLDQQFLEEYENDQLRGQLFLGFSLMMIIIASLGLLGLASFIAEQRTKEVSIRKVLGAEVGSLVTLLVKDFVWLVLIGALPAFYFGYTIMNDWLQEFEYHVDMKVSLFVITLAIILLVTMLTTGYHAYKAAIGNPSEKLKYE